MVTFLIISLVHHYILDVSMSRSKIYTQNLNITVVVKQAFSYLQTNYLRYLYCVQAHPVAVAPLPGG